MPLYYSVCVRFLYSHAHPASPCYEPLMGSAHTNPLCSAQQLWGILPGTCMGVPRLPHARTDSKRSEHRDACLQTERLAQPSSLPICTHIWVCVCVYVCQSVLARRKEPAAHAHAELVRSLQAELEAAKRAAYEEKVKSTNLEAQMRKLR